MTYSTPNPIPPGPAELYQHTHPPVKNANELSEKKLSFGQRVADRVAAVIGSWPFIILQSVLLVIWIGINVYLMRHFKDKAFDPYPFILLNLALSFQAAYTGPIVMMSQNRQNEKDRFSAHCDYECNQTAEEEIRIIMEHLVHQDRLLTEITRKLESLNAVQTKAASSPSAPEPRPGQ